MKRRKKIIILGAIAGVFVLFLVSAEFTSRSKFCSTCHYMKPFYQSWKTSSHGDIECQVCHYPPGLRSKLRAKVEGLLQVGRYWTKLYLKSKPWAEIPDEACLREGCHDKRVLEGQAKFNKVVFDHKVHFEDLRRGKQLRCTSCHSQIIQGEHITVTESSCFICHFKESDHFPQIGECSHCHKKEDLVAEKTSRYNHTFVYDNGFKCDKCHNQVIVGDGAVPLENCYKCHWETDRLERYEETDLMHATHISSHKIECNLCHLEIQHKIVRDIETIADCRTCHTGFHEAQKILYAGRGGKGVPHATPNIMFEKGLNCKGCHIFHEESGGTLLKSDTLISREKACESCHGTGYGKILRLWESAAEKRLTRMKAVLETARKEVLRSGVPRKDEARRVLEEAVFNIDIVEKGKSVHNMAYSQELLQASFTKIEEALQLVGSSFKPERFLTESSLIPAQCSSCHAGIEEISSEIYGLMFPHKNHVHGQKMNCGACHSNERKHGEFIGSKNGCASCHHQETSRDCGRCHKLQQTIYAGGALNGMNAPQDIMAEGGVGCADCHLDAEKKVVRSDAAKCADCHEKEYAATFTEWRGTVRSLLDSLKALIREKKNTALAPAAKTRLSEAESLIRKVELDGSRGVHNYAFIEQTLTNFIEIIKSIDKTGQ